MAAKVLTLMEENGRNNSSANAFFNDRKRAKPKPNSNQTKAELEQFSLRLSTALRKGRHNNNNNSAASNRLFTRVNHQASFGSVDGDFRSDIFATNTTTTTELNFEREDREKGEGRIVVQNKVDNWSLDACLNEINSIKYDNFTLREEIESSPVNENDVGVRSSFVLTQQQFRRPESRRPRPTSISAKSAKSESSVCSSEDELLLFDEGESSVGSSRSSISWAPDAVEAQLTLQLARLWEDIELVCSGQSQGRPGGMSDSVFQECLLWKRAFPEKSERPSRFSTMALVASDDEEDDSDTSIPTPTNKSQMFEFDSPPISAKYRPSSLKRVNDPSNEDYYDFDSRADCVTPNPNNSSEYVTAWLTDYHHGHESREMGQIAEEPPTEPQQMISESQILDMNQFRKESPTSAFPVSRPVSCNTAGHLIAPFPTGNYPFHLQQQERNTGSGKSTNSKNSGKLSTLTTSQNGRNKTAANVIGDTRRKKSISNSSLVELKKKAESQTFKAEDIKDKTREPNKYLFQNKQQRQQQSPELEVKSIIVGNQNSIPRNNTSSSALSTTTSINSKHRSSNQSLRKYPNTFSEEREDSSQNTPFLLWLFQNGNK